MISEALVRKGKSLNAGAWKLKLWERAVWSLLAEADALLHYRGGALKVGAGNNESKEFQEVFENAELYINDAENFLKQGKDENAVLSIGYADGLVDALRMAKGIDPKM